MKKVLFILLLGSMAITACGPKISNEQQAQLEGLTTKVDSLVEIVNVIDSVEVQKMVEDFFTKKQFVQFEMEDTIPREIIFKLDSFVQLRKPMGFLRDQYLPIKAEANIMKKQLEDLAHDVDNRLIEEKKFDKYYQLEINNYAELRAAAIQLSEVYQRTIVAYNDQVPFATQLIEDYKAKQNETD